MERVWRYVAVAVFTVGLLVAAAPTSYATTIIAEPPLEIKKPSPLIISAYSVAEGQPQYIEIYNDSSQIVRAADWSVSVSWSLRSKDVSIDATAPPPLTLPIYVSVDDSVPYIPPGGYVVVSFNGLVSNALSQIQLPDDSEYVSPYLYVSELRIEDEKYRPYTRGITEAQAIEGSRMRLKVGVSGYTSTYGAVDSDKVYQDDDYYYAPSGAFPLAPVEILANPKTCSPLDSDSSCTEYVKFHNESGETVDFTGVRLRAGDTVTELSGEVAHGTYALFAVSLPNSGGFISLEDKYGIHIYENTVTQYPDAGAASKKGQSWAWFETGWDWAIPSPGGINTPILVDEPGKGSSTQGLVPCAANQYRSPETNRCRLIAATTSSSLKPCAANQYRSPETNRCRNLATVSSSSSSLKPCAANQYRNPETNRCRLLSSLAGTTLEPCAAGQERNPETNRCRKMASTADMPKADFPVESIKQQAGDMTGWLAFAGVGSVAIGYGIWEWRRELSAFASRIVRVGRK